MNNIMIAIANLLYSLNSRLYIVEEMIKLIQTDMKKWSRMRHRLTQMENKSS